MSEPLDTTHRDNITCPHCGHEYRDSWEVNFGSGIEGDTELECEECDKPFIASRHCTVTYSTQKKA